MKAKAMVLVKPGRMEMQEFDVVEPKPGQILVRIGVTSVCASDPKIFRGETPFEFYPIIMGHELTGKVSDIGT
jgi:D-arabinose 1-dehydrogenase-like Zn-dependent alcohol dehydrogenase